MVTGGLTDKLRELIYGRLATCNHGDSLARRIGELTGTGLSFTPAGGGGWTKFVRGALDAAETVGDLIEVSKSALRLANGEGDLDDLVTLGVGAAGLGLEGLPGPNINNGPEIQGIDPQSVLEGLSKKNLKHSKKHLPEFQKLDPNINEDSLRELGASLVKPENLISSSDSSQKVFEQVVDIGGVPTRVRVALNERNKLHSVHIRYK